jgi:hypothetical protein
MCQRVGVSASFKRLVRLQPLAKYQIQSGVGKCLVSPPGLSNTYSQWTAGLLLMTFYFYFLPLVLSILALNPLIFQTSPSTWFFFEFCPCSFNYNFLLFEIIYKIDFFLILSFFILFLSIKLGTHSFNCYFFYLFFFNLISHSFFSFNIKTIFDYRSFHCYFFFSFSWFILFSISSFIVLFHIVLVSDLVIIILIAFYYFIIF